MTINVKMLASRQAPGGTTYQAGSSYDVPDSLAHMFVNANSAVYTDGSAPIDGDEVPVKATKKLTGGSVILDPATGLPMSLGGATSITAANLLIARRAGTLSVGGTYVTENGSTYLARSASNFVPVGDSPILTGPNATLFGDSIAENQQNAGNPTTLSIVKWANANLPVPVEIKNWRGQSGAGLGAGAGALNVLAYQAPLVAADTQNEIAWLHAGVNAALAVTTSQSVEGAAASLKSILDLLSPVKQLIIVDGVTPCNIANSYRTLEIPALNTKMSAVCAGYPNVLFNEIYSTVLDTASVDQNPIAGTMYDSNLHPNSRGAALIGEASASNIAKRVVIASPYTSVAVAGMPDFTGTTGTKTVGSGSITGNVPTNLNVQVASGSAAVTTTIRTPAGQEGGRLNLAIANSGGAVSLVKTSLADKTLFNASLNNGDQVRAWIGFRFKSKTLATNLQIYLQLNGSTIGWWAGRYTSKETPTIDYDAPFIGYFPTDVFTINAAVTQFDVVCAVEVGATTGAADIDIWGFKLEKLTTP